ncbi:MAG: PQQ-binding-like beta-propeller repeat protein [Limisphaerales bacterium]
MNESTREISTGSGVAAGAGGGAKYRRLRVWPALGLVLLLVAARMGPAYMEGGLSRHWMIAVFGPMLCCVLLLVWWVAASRATWRERLFGFLGLIGALVGTVAFVHPTMRGAGTNYLTAPMGMVLFGLSAFFLADRRPMIRTGVAVMMALVGFSYSILLRNEGMTGEYVFETRWRWSASREEELFARDGSNTVETGVATTNLVKAEITAEALAKVEWSGFRGADRSGRVRGAQFATNWTTQAPRKLWKIAVGPGWSSFAVAGNFLFTQEQRGAFETTVCYEAETGREVWKRQVEARLEDPMGGPGPRATPTIGDEAGGGGLFVVGATGIFMKLDAKRGDILWQHDLKSLAGRAAPPMWGFSASPLVTGALAIVYGGGAGDKGLLAFNREKGTLVWSAAAGIDSYSSAQLSTIAGEELVLLVSNDGLLGLEPASGKERLNHAWKMNGYRALQPAAVGDVVLIFSPMGPGTRALEIKKSNGELVAEELWTSKVLKPDFTDFVEHEGYLYGIDAGIFTCVDPKSGERKWKGGRYGKGQVVLLESSDLLLVLAEDGRVVLLKADAREHTEVASFQALEGKTWNHPVVVGDRLYVRNSQEAACFQLPMVEAKVSKL